MLVSCHLQDKVEVPDSRYSKQKMLLGTHTSEEEQNHLLLAEVVLPTEDSELSSAQYDEEQAETGGYGASPGQCYCLPRLPPMYSHTYLIAVIHPLHLPPLH